MTAASTCVPGCRSPRPVLAPSSAVTSAAARRLVDGASDGNSVESAERRRVGPLRRSRDRAGRSGWPPPTRRSPPKTNTNAMPPNRSAPERADRRAEQQPAHLDRAVQPERLATTFRRGRVGQVAAGGRVVDRGRQTRPRRAGRGTRAAPVKTSGSMLKTPVADEADDHQRDPRGPVGQPAEDRLADQPRGRPGGDDQPEERQVDPLLR